MSDQPVCIYCAGKRYFTQWSHEHIWPRKLGGTSSPEIFRTRQVCKVCNDMAGLWVEPPFHKNWFMQVDAAIAGLRYLPRDAPGVTSLIYLGFDDTFPVASDEVCERWSGPSQETIYHVHKRDEPHWDTIPGGNPIRRKSNDRGRVYFFLTSPEDYWTLTAIKSIINHFEHVRPRCLTQLEGFPRRLPISRHDDPPTSEEEAHEITWLLEHGGGRGGTRMSLNVTFADRFLAKLAIGLGHTILGSRVSSSGYADRLRTLLWSRDSNEREALEIRGTGFWGREGEDQKSNPFTFAGAWTISLGLFFPAFGYSIITPGGRTMAMMISDDSNLWRSGVTDEYRDMQTYVIIPQRKLFLGPFRMIDYISHQLGRRPIEQLKLVQQAQVALTDLPPRRLGEADQHDKEPNAAQSGDL